MIFVTISGTSSCEFSRVGTMSLCKVSWLSDLSLCFVVGSKFSLCWPPLTPPRPLWVSQPCFWGHLPSIS